MPTSSGPRWIRQSAILSTGARTGRCASKLHSPAKPHTIYIISVMRLSLDRQAGYEIVVGILRDILREVERIADGQPLQTALFTLCRALFDRRTQPLRQALIRATATAAAD